MLKATRKALEASLKIAQGNTDAAIADYNDARDDALEEAAKVAKAIWEKSSYNPYCSGNDAFEHGVSYAAEEIEAAIRAMKRKAND